MPLVVSHPHSLNGMRVNKTLHGRGGESRKWPGREGEGERTKYEMKKVSGRKNNKGKKEKKKEKNGGGPERGRVCEVGVEHEKEIEGFHLPTASLRLSAQRVIKDQANRVP